jgi:hypothetical protein
MTRKSGSSSAEIAKRQQLVLRYHLRGYTAEEIAKALKDSPQTIYRDIAALKQRLAERVSATDLYSLQRAFAELDQEWREAWVLYQRPAAVMQTKNGPVTLDDRVIKMMLLSRIHDVVKERSRLSGFYSPKVMERITMLETAQGRGFQLERFTFDEQLARETEELRNNEGLRRSEGLLSDSND